MTALKEKPVLFIPAPSRFIPKVFLEIAKSEGFVLSYPPGDTPVQDIVGVVDPRALLLDVDQEGHLTYAANQVRSAKTEFIRPVFPLYPPDHTGHCSLEDRLEDRFVDWSRTNAIGRFQPEKTFEGSTPTLITKVFRYKDESLGYVSVQLHNIAYVQDKIDADPNTLAIFLVGDATGFTLSDDNAAAFRTAWQTYADHLNFGK